MRRTKGKSLHPASTMPSALHKINMILLDTEYRFTATAKGDKVRIRNAHNEKVWEGKTLFDAIKWLLPNGHNVYSFETLWKHVAYSISGPIEIPWPHKHLHSCRVYQVSNRSKKKKWRGMCVQPLRVADPRGIRYWCIGPKDKEYKIRSCDLVTSKSNDDWGF